MKHYAKTHGPQDVWGSGWYDGRSEVRDMRVRKDTTSSTSRTARVTLAKKHYLKYLKDRSRYTIFDEKTAFFHSRLRGARKPASHFGGRQTTGRNRQKPAKTGRSFGALQPLASWPNRSFWCKKRDMKAKKHSPFAGNGTHFCETYVLA